MVTITPSRKIAIATRYIGPTNYRGSRYKAYTDSGRSVTLNASPELSNEANHRAAAQALCAKMGWSGALLEGYTKEGYVYVFSD